MSRKHRDYDNDYPSVTTVLGELRKIGLEQWYMRNTYKFCQSEMAKGKTCGTDIHKAIERYIATNELKVETEYPDEVTNALQSFVLFKKEHPEIKLKFSETKMTSEEHKYNGTMDVVASNAGGLVLGDWKNSTCKGKDKPEIWPEYITQLSAYRNLYQETSGIYVTEGFIAVFSKDKVAYNYREVSDAEMEYNFNEIFLPALRICYARRQKWATIN